MANQYNILFLLDPGLGNKYKCINVAGLEQFTECIKSCTEVTLISLSSCLIPVSMLTHSREAVSNDVLGCWIQLGPGLAVVGI